MTRWLLLLGAIGTEVAGSLAVKGALTHPWLYAVVGTGYLASFGLLTAVLKRGMGVGVAYGIWGALGVVLTAVMSALLFGEPITALMTAGIALVVAGVLVVELGSQRARRATALEGVR